jgi:hypothetical protein
MIPAVKIGLVVALLWAGWRASRMLRTGRIRVFDTDGPVLMIARQDRPFAYWSFIMLFYAVLIAIAVGATSF